MEQKAATEITNDEAVEGTHVVKDNKRSARKM